jgi:glycosyltransferase involved in cell wall biosynthesis
MRIAIVTDAWRPQVNGVVTTLVKTGEMLESFGHQVCFVTPEPFKTVPCPTYPSIRLALKPKRHLTNMLDEFSPDVVHIATEGPLGLTARSYCQQTGLSFTTSYHTQFPYYIRMRVPLPLRVSYAFLRWFHSAAVRTLVPTESLRKELIEWGFENVEIWSRGVDTKLFRPRNEKIISDEQPILMYMGRVAVEKNIEAFLNADVPGTKYVIGDGPDVEMLKRKHPQVRFTGFKFGEELARYLAATDVFVFPSRTDTFGLVMLEAMACGAPIAAYPVTGPLDVVRNGETGVLDENLEVAVRGALKLDRQKCRDYALKHSWEACTRQFEQYLVVNGNKQKKAV